MIFFNSFIVLLFCFAIGLPSKAEEGNSLKDHQVLIQTIKTLGVGYFVNPPSCDDEKLDGVYHQNSGRMVVCLDNYTKKINKVTWTKNDLDTLRHEAHHIVQDCASGEIGDGKMSRIFIDLEKFKSFIDQSGIPKEKLYYLYKYYMDHRDASPEEAAMEVEAYAVANSIDAISISNKLKEFCDER